MTISLEELEAAHESGQNPMAYIPLADELRRRQRYPEAIAACREGLDRYGISVRGQTVLGKVYSDLKKYDLAVEALRVAVDLAPESFEPRFLMAKCLSQRCEYMEAREVLDTLRHTYKTHPEVMQLGRVIDAELHGVQQVDPDSAGGFGEEMTSFRNELLEIVGVESLTEFGLREKHGDLIFDAPPGADLSDEMRFTIIESARLASKLQFGSPNHLTIESSQGRIVLQIMEGKGALVITTSDVKLGKLRYRMKQYLQALSI